ncbi:MAG: hypothetical protein ACKORJ_10765 [Bacteroidota bacterium]
MDLKVIIWIIGLLIYFYAQSKKGKKQAPEVEEPSSQPRPGKPITFEDLLREIQQSRQPDPVPPPTTSRTPEVIDYEEEIPEEAEPIEVVPTYKRQEEVTAVYEEAKRAAFQRASLEETVKLKEIPTQPGKFKGYEQDSRPAFAASIAEDLRSPESVRKAFILSEVLNRRF